MYADSPLEWTEDGQPRSRRFGDIYFSAHDGLAETRAVFLQGCDLPQAWRGRRRFVVGELGFGTGLNVAALLDLWRRERPADAHLHIFTVEAYPLSAGEAARALSAWPELAETADLLIERWPGRANGLHRIDLPEFAAVIDLAVMEAAEALSGWTGRADAWFLDGFAPALNPDMWRHEVLSLVAARSAPGAMAATFTVAGEVRRGLAGAGFEVAKRPGFGRKRERLEARAPGRAATDPTHAKVMIIGAGIAGASAARAVRALGGEAVVIDAEGPGAGASGNPAALVTPGLDAGLGAKARLFAQAFRSGVRLYARHPEAILGQGVRQLAAKPGDAGRFARVAASDLFEPGSMQALSADGGLDLCAALVIDPAPILAAWCGQSVRARVARLDRDGAGWSALDAEGRLIARADAVILAAGLGSQDLAAAAPALTAVRGQLSWAEGVSPPRAAAWGGYVVPARSGLLFGATHDRGETGSDLRAADHARNLATLAAKFPDLAADIDPARLGGRASIRAASADHLPLAGPLEDGLFLLSGFGGRGFTQAPLLAEHVAALALGAPSPLPAALQALVTPSRFAERAARRAHSGPTKDAL